MNALITQLSDADQARLEETLLDFDQYWTPQHMKVVAGQVAAESREFRLAALTEIAKIDLEHHWSQRERKRLESYIGRFSELQDSEEALRDLLRAEIEVRGQHDATPDEAELRERFPALGDEVVKLLADAEAGARVSAIRRARRSELEQASDSTASIATTEQETLPPNSQLHTLSQRESELGEQFGRYRLLQELGHGAMGTVYLAEDTELRRRVALKRPRLVAQEEAALLQRFYREAYAAATLDHPNICPVYDIGEHAGVPYITMAYVDGRPLSDIIRERKLLNQRSVAVMLRKIALALAEAHEAGVVHRDLKPGNIMLNHRSEPIVMDFGLARHTEATDEERLTKDGMLIGTPGYMSPEQVDGDMDKIGPASDTYSLGVVLYELLCGELPFRGSVVSVIGKILRDEPDPPSTHRADIDPRLEAICVKMMGKLPADRYASMRDVADALGAFIKARGQDSSSEPPPVAVITPALLEAQRTQIQQLYDAGQWREASLLLQRMSELTEPVALPYVQWAQDESQKLHVLWQQKQAAAKQDIANARVLLEQYEYAAVAQRLMGLDKELLTPEAKEMLEEALKLQEEVDLLINLIERGLCDAKQPGTLKNLQRLLQLKPNDLVTRELYRRFRWQQRLGWLGLSIADTFAFADHRTNGNLLPVICGATLVVTLLCAVVIIIKTNDGTISITTGEGETVIEVTPRQEPSNEQPNGNNGFESLFNGRDLTGWSVYQGEMFGDPWGVESNAIVGRSRPGPIGLLVSERRIGDFILRAEFRLTHRANGNFEGADGGIRFWADRDESGKPQGSMEIALRDPAPTEVAWRIGGLHGLVPPSSDAFKPGEWNSVELQLESPRLQVKLNEVLIQDVDLTTLDNQWVKDLVARGSGHFVLDSGGGQVEYRNLRFRELSPSVSGTADSTPGLVRRLSGSTGPVRCLAFSPDGRHAYSTSGWPAPDGPVLVWDLETGTVNRTLTKRNGGSDWICLSKDGQTLVRGGDGPTIRWLKTSNGDEIGKLDTHANEFAFLSDERRLLIGEAGSRRFQLWSLESKQRIKDYGIPNVQIFSVAASTDGRRVACGAHDGVVRVFDSETGDVIAQLRGHTHWVEALSFSPDGKLLLSGANDSTARLFDVAQKRPVHTFRHDDAVMDVTFTPDGRHCLTSSKDTNVRIWNVQSGEEVHRFEDHNEWVWCVRVSPDGRYALSGGGGVFADGKSRAGSDWDIRLWRLPGKEEQVPLAADAEGFVSLFNGRDLTGWQQVHGTTGKPLSNQVEVTPQQTIRFIGTEEVPSSFRTGREYGDFELSLEVKFANNTSDTGIVFPIKMPRGAPVVEAQLAMTFPAGHLFGTLGAAQHNNLRFRQPGEWNHVICKHQSGSSIQVIVNGQHASSIDLSEEKYSKLPKQGYISLLNWHGQAVGCEVRNIRIKTL